MFSAHLESTAIQVDCHSRQVIAQVGITVHLEQQNPTAFLVLLDFTGMGQLKSLLRTAQNVSLATIVIGRDLLNPLPAHQATSVLVEALSHSHVLLAHTAIQLASDVLLTALLVLVATIVMALDELHQQACVIQASIAVRRLTPLLLQRMPLEVCVQQVATAPEGLPHLHHA